MRLALLVPVLICVAVPAYAEGVRESRYGPTTPRHTNAAAVRRYDGPMLGWSNKRQASTAAPIAATPARAAPAAYTPPPVANAVAPPTSLYATPRPSAAVNAAAAPGAAKDWSSYRSARVANVATAPVSAPPPLQVAATTGMRPGATGARYYSVDREYGLTPDAAPRPGPDTRVLITAAEPPPEPKDATPIHGSVDWLAAGVAGDDDQDSDSDSRRAKIRNEAL